MKTKEEIEQLAKSKFITNNNISLSESNKTMCRRSAFVKGYTQCQEDKADKKYTEKDIQNVLDGFTNEAPGQYIKTNFIELLNKKD